MAGLFISYRRQDAASYAGRLRDSIAKRYGSDAVFFDLIDLSPGENWEPHLKDAVAQCDSMMVVIGPEWISATDPAGQRRIDDPNDFVRSEIAAALRLGRPVIPVLVGGASMPDSDQLPEEVRGLVDRHAISLSEVYWDSALSPLFRTLDPVLRHPGAAPPAHEVPALPVGSDPELRRLPGAAAPPPPGAAAPETARKAGITSRLRQAFDVLVGRAVSERTSASPARISSSPPDATAVEPPSPSPTRSSTTARRPDVFVSYSTEDQAFADEVVNTLERLGRDCWIAHRDIPPGVPSWAEPIVTAIANSRLVLVLLTARSIASIEVLREVTLAADERIPLLPVSLDDSPLSPGLRYFFVAGQRLDLAGSARDDRLLSIAPAVERRLALQA